MGREFTKKQMIEKILKGLAFDFQLEDKGCFQIHYHDKTFQVLADDRRDAPFVTVELLEFTTVAPGTSHYHIFACNYLNRTPTPYKVYMDEGNATISASTTFLYIHDMETLTTVLESTIHNMDNLPFFYKQALSATMEADKAQ